MTNNKLRIHIKNNHASLGTFPPTIESEEVFTITEERFGDACERFPAVAEQVEAFIDWDLEHFAKSMETADVLVTWDFPTTNLAKVAPRLKLIHIIGAGVEHLCPMNWLPEGVKVVNNRGVHAAKGGEFGMMAVLMLNNCMPSIVENQRRANWESLYSSPVAEKTLVVIGVGNIGGAAGQQCARLGMEVIGISRHGKPVEGFSQVLTPKALVEVLPKADFVLMATPLTPETENLLDLQKLLASQANLSLHWIPRELNCAARQRTPSTTNELLLPYSTAPRTHLETHREKSTPLQDCPISHRTAPLV